MNSFILPKRAASRQAQAPAKPRQLAKEATRARIVEVAKAQLEALGFESTSIRGVARAAGVATGTVLLHYPDKKDLLHTALFEDLELAWRGAQKQLGKRTLARDLTHLAAVFFAYYAARPKLSRALLRESLFADPPWNTRFAGQVAEVHSAVVALAERAKDRGELTRETDNALVSASFFSFYYFALLAWLQGGQPAPERLFGALLTQYLVAHRPSPARRPKLGPERQSATNSRRRLP